MQPPGLSDTRLLRRKLKPSTWWGFIFFMCLGWAEMSVTIKSCSHNSIPTISFESLPLACCDSDACVRVLFFWDERRYQSEKRIPDKQQLAKIQVYDICKCTSTQHYTVGKKKKKKKIQGAHEFQLKSTFVAKMIKRSFQLEIRRTERQ